MLTDAKDLTDLGSRLRLLATKGKL